MVRQLTASLIIIIFFGNVCFGQTINRVAFTENKGQVHDQFDLQRTDILFSGNTGNLDFYLLKSGISYQLSKPIGEVEPIKLPTLDQTPQLPKQNRIIYRVDVNWIGSNANFNVDVDNAFDGYVNYYFPSCPNGALFVRSFGGVTYKNIYEGVDVKWYSNKEGLKYDYVVSPGANYSTIQLNISGAQSISLSKKGELVIATPIGNIIEEAPLVMQGEKILSASWVINKNVVSFKINNVDPSKSFVIDPGVRIWGTYYGGIGPEVGQATSVDSQNNVYMSGVTNSYAGTVMATVGSHQYIASGGNDCFLAKFTPSGTRIWATYYGGGTGEDYAYACPVDANDNVYMAGRTESTVNIATAGSHQQNYGGGIQDAFLVKFNSAGVRQWSTYYGGSCEDLGYGAACDKQGNVFLSGYTCSSGSISSPGSFQPAFGGGLIDGFLVKFNSAGVRQWGTYYGGSGDEKAYSCSVDKLGNLYLPGQSSTPTSTTIASAAAHQTTNNGANDAFLAKFDPSGNRVWATYYGEASDDFAHGSAVDYFGNVYICGATQSSAGTNIPSAAGHQTVYGGGNFDGFIAKFNSLGVRQWGTYYGGESIDFVRSCAVDTLTHSLFAGGYTASTLNISTPGSQQTIIGATCCTNGLLTKFDLNGNRQWGTYYGGTQTDLAWACSVDHLQRAYITGYAYSSGPNVISTPGSHQVNIGSPTDAEAYLAKFMSCSASPSFPDDNTSLSNKTICAPSTTTLYASGSGTISWFTVPLGGTSVGSGNSYVTSTLSPGTYSFYAQDSTCAPGPRAMITVTVSNCTAMNELRKNDQLIFIYPNPAKNELFLECSNKLSLLSWAIYDINGKRLLVGSGDLTSVEELKSGLYLIRIYTNERNYNFKFIKE